MIKNSKFLVVLVLILVVLGGLVLSSPKFLLYSSPYKKADAIILLLGPDFKARLKEAHRLINDGMADYFIIPAYHKVYRIDEKGMKKYLSPHIYPVKSDKKDVATPARFYEDTHLEILESQKVMSGYGLKSAIFVSSPYHMRRIKLMVRKVFDTNKNDYYFVPTRYEKAPASYRELSLADWKKVRNEYSKIVWFFIYFPWSK